MINRGGKREGAGRPKKQDAEKKQRLDIWVPPSEIEAVGGEPEAKKIAKKAITKEAKKKKKSKAAIKEV